MNEIIKEWTKKNLMETSLRERLKKERNTIENDFDCFWSSRGKNPDGKEKIKEESTEEIKV